MHAVCVAALVIDTCALYIHALIPGTHQSNDGIILSSVIRLGEEAIAKDFPNF